MKEREFNDADGLGCMIFFALLLVVFFVGCGKVKDGIIDIIHAVRGTDTRCFVCEKCGSTNAVETAALVERTFHHEDVHNFRHEGR